MTEGRHGHGGHVPPPALAAGAPGLPRLDVAGLLAGRRILVTGATGFLGKVALAMLLDRYPDVGEVFVLVRPGAGGGARAAEERFFGKVAASRPFDPLRARHGDGFERFLRARCRPLAGDVSDPLFGLTEGDLAALRAGGGLDLVLNSAGLVDFDPPLELALGVNVEGARAAVELCRRTGAALLHVSTCFVAGNRDGVVFEDEPIPGYFPRRPGVEARPRIPALEGADFSLEAEVADAAARVAEVRARAEDRVLQSTFQDRARARLEEEGRAGDEKALRLAVAREKRLWLSTQLVALGMERARHWGWPNTYTYTKSLGEQAIAGAPGLHWTLARPSIVESALRFPFPGWNEGFTTSAPLAFLGLKGHRSFPAAEKAILDVVPVDLVAAGLLLASAELLERRARAPGGGSGQVCHLASGDTNPLWARRAVELSALYRRRFYRERTEGNATVNAILSRIEPFPVSRGRYEALSAPALGALARGARGLLDRHGPRWGAPRVRASLHGLAEALDGWTARFEKVEALWALYLPFVWDNRYVFRCAAIRALRDRLGPEDRARLPWDPEALDWRSYWLDVHMKGMEEWVFPGFEEADEVKAEKPHRDLLELLDAASARWKDRVALRMAGASKERVTYGELQALSGRVAAWLAAAGVVKGDRVLLASENRPEWAIAFFGILRAGAAAVPVDPKLSEPELANLWRSAGAKVGLLSDEATELAPGLAALAAAAVPGARVVRLGEALAGGPAAPTPRVAPDDLASLLFTSGTTGAPKGVMLSHRNFASLVAKLVSTFDLGPGDGMLSVLPLHHTFEFTCGLLVPLSRGAEVEYLDELTADRIGEALGSGRVTALIGVPALWSLLHRRVTQELAAKPAVVEQAFEWLGKANAALRDSALGWNLGKVLFWPVHRRFGGRLRLLVSGGSAIDPAVQAAFRDMGFDLYEGYGLTEAAPVLAVSTPQGGAPAGSVGTALPGVELRIDAPDAAGVGEVLARGPNVMLGYWRGPAGGAPGVPGLPGLPGVDDALTSEVLEGGWLRTGDLGRLDAAGNLTLVGRKKDLVLDASGKNVYPDEVEERYRAPDLVKELCVVGLPDGAAEKLAMIVVPDYGEGARARPREEVRAEIEAHVRRVSAALPFHQRVKAWHFFEGELPRTATRKVKRPLVREELLRLEAAAAAGRRARGGARDRAGPGDAWVEALVAELARRPRGEVGPSSRLAADLGFDSLLLAELAAALEEAGVPARALDGLHALATVGELSRAVAAAGAGRRAAPPAATSPASAKDDRGARRDGEELAVPAPLAALGRAFLGVAQRALYEDLYGAKVIGRAHVPHDRNVLVVANHASHLDMGLVKVAMAEEGRRLAALAARDYFFDTPLKRAYFENFTNLIPMDREGSLRQSLSHAAEALRRGHHLLIFPEGTRSRDGELQPFYPTAGYLALSCGVDVLPVHLAGTFDALPPGGALPRRADLEVRFGPVLPLADLRRATDGLARSEAWRAATQVIERAVRALRDASRPAPRPPAAAPVIPAAPAVPAAPPGTAAPGPAPAAGPSPAHARKMKAEDP